MDNICMMIFKVEETLDSKERRHIAGGILLSISFLFGGLALTALTLNRTEVKNV